MEKADYESDLMVIGGVISNQPEENLRSVAAILCGFVDGDLSGEVYFGSGDECLLAGRIAAMLTSGEKCDPSMIQILHDYLENSHYSDVGELYRFLDSKIGKVES